MTEAPPTDEGWYVAHDFRRIDWDAWRDATERTRRRAIEEGVAYLERYEQVADADEGESAVFTVLGDEADLLILHMRPTLDALSAAERSFEATAFAGFTERAESYVSVTEVSGYVSQEYFEADEAELDEGTRRYMESKLHPEIPDGEYVSFYPMSKSREPGANWYDLSFDERAELMAEHGDTGREYAGRISQVISSSVGFESFEWGVTLFGADPTDIKDIVYEMRFDEVSSVYGEFGEFYVGRRFPPTDLQAVLAGEPVPTAAHDGEAAHAERGEAAHAEGGGAAHAGNGGAAHGESEGAGHAEAAHAEGGESGHAESGESDHTGPTHTTGEGGESDAEAIREELAELDIYAGSPNGEDVFATVLYSEADTEPLFEEVEGLRGNFDHYGTHVKTAVYEGDDRAAVVSIWETASAAETAAGFLSELPGIVERAGEEDGFGTMGMFYTVESDHQEAFVERFGEVGQLLNGMDGHYDTELLTNRENEDDMFIASQWASKSDAMAFFGSDEFRDTVQWGRDVLADRPRHVFLA